MQQQLAGFIWLGLLMALTRLLLRATLGVCLLSLLEGPGEDGCFSGRWVTACWCRQVLGVYSGRRWALIEEHLHDVLGRQSRCVGRE